MPGHQLNHEGLRYEASTHYGRFHCSTRNVIQTTRVMSSPSGRLEPMYFIHDRTRINAATALRDLVRQQQYLGVIGLTRLVLSQPNKLPAHPAAVPLRRLHNKALSREVENAVRRTGGSSDHRRSHLRLYTPPL